MRIVFKVIAIFGILSFLGGLKNDVFFFFGLILAAIFGFFGWRPKKNLEDKKTASNDNLRKILKQADNKTFIKERFSEARNDDKIINNERQVSETELKQKIEECNKSIELLSISFDDGLFNPHEFIAKKERLETEIFELSQRLNLKIATNKVVQENNGLFDRLLVLKTKELISNEEYQTKYKNLLSSLLIKEELEKNEINQNTQNAVNEADTLDSNITKNYFGRKKVNLIWFIFSGVILVGVFIVYLLSPSSSLYSASDISRRRAKTLHSEDKIANKLIVPRNTLESTKVENKEISQSEKDKNKSPLDLIYLGTNLFHEGSGGTWGRATISKKGGQYWINGVHKISNGDWIKIEGSITNPSIDGFTFQGKISAYSPTRAKSNEEYGKWVEKDGELIHITDIDYPDTCVWVGKTEAYKLFKYRKYWRIKSHNCYSYTTDIDIFHN